MTLISLDNCELSGKSYSGAEYKIGIKYNDSDWIVKFGAKENDSHSESYGNVSEYLGSKIFESLNIPVHETMLGLYAGNCVVAVKDFLYNTSYSFVPFREVGESSLDSINDAYNHRYTYDEIVHMIYSNKKLYDPDSVVERFWDMYVVDALIGNFDRHGYNWGYLRDSDFMYSLAPVFDNGSCLFPKLAEDNIDLILSSRDEILKRIYTFPTSQIRYGSKKSSYYDVISSKEFDGCTKASLKLIDKLDLALINNIIDELPCVTDKRKEFYTVMLRERFNLLFKEVFKHSDRISLYKSNMFKHQ